jgi:carbon monoxide dehydrogenase subunit G
VIDTEQSIVIAAPIGQVWDFAQDIRAWAKLMPGLQGCDIVDDDNSRWTLKVGAGALVRTVNVVVHVERWAGPDEVDFTYVLDNDPVKGGGTYRASALGTSQTRIDLAVKVEGTGPMAPMWEAMGRPLLPKLARGFAEQFKIEVEQFAGVAPPEPANMAARTQTRSLLVRLIQWIRRLFGSAASAK